MGRVAFSAWTNLILLGSRALVSDVALTSLKVIDVIGPRPERDNVPDLGWSFMAIRIFMIWSFMKIPVLVGCAIA